MIKDGELEQQVKRNDEIIIEKLEEIKNILSENLTIKAETEEPRYKEVKITTIIGPQADKMINSLNRGEGFTFRDNSVEGVHILEVYADVDTGFWWG
jgi:hypothetical protein